MNKFQCFVSCFEGWFGVHKMHVIATLHWLFRKYILIQFILWDLQKQIYDNCYPHFNTRLINYNNEPSLPGRNVFWLLTSRKLINNNYRKIERNTLYAQRNLFWILLNHIKNRKMVNTIWFRVNLIRFRQDLSVCGIDQWRERVFDLWFHYSPWH